MSFKSPGGWVGQAVAGMAQFLLSLWPQPHHTEEETHLDSILSITVRDSVHPCAPYHSTGHPFYAQIFQCDGTPLPWRGVNYSWFPMQVAGPGRGRIHAQVRVPPGCYLIRAVATCKNVVTDWAWVDLGCNQTVCVNLVPPSVIQCTNRVVLGLQIADRLPKDPKLPAPPAEDEIHRMIREAEKEGPPKAAE